MRPFVVAALISLLAGCSTPAERAARMEREIDEMVATYGPACERLGYKSETDAWRDCILRLNATATRYSRIPTTTSCFGHRGFFQCSTF